MVAQVQKALADAGFDPGPLDGTFGPRTQDAVLSFQRARGLSPDPNVGLSTAAALELALEHFPRPCRRISRRDGEPGLLCSPPPKRPSATQVTLAPDSVRDELLRVPTDAGGVVRPPPKAQPSQRLSEMHIEVVPDEAGCGGTVGYPPGSDPTDVVNYLEIVDAFSHVPFPGMWASLGIGEPLASALSWDWLFQRISDPFHVNCLRSGLNQPGCAGETGQTNGQWIDLCDCATRDVVMHEIGHVVQHRGIEGQVPPLYHPGVAPPRPGLGTNQPSTSSIDDLYRIFGDFSESRSDGGIKVGFMTLYSENTLGENFAEHFMSYVYFGDAFRTRIGRQLQQFGSNLLAEKYGYVSRIFTNITFADGGLPRVFEGFPI
jgi:peptidoglycan hydrolase-like protein with peptidoglycan-binding domain